jgi:glycine cleavage system H lipoate-binding protein/ABC-type phosphate transport system substrate-binding protein
MKNNILLISGLLLLICGNISSKEKAISSNATSGDSIVIVSSPDLFELSSLWAKEYQLVNPAAKIQLTSLLDNNMTALHPDANLEFVSRGYYASLNKEAAWKEVIGRDVIVPVINSKNPFMEEIIQQGVSSERLLQIFTHPDNRNWATLIENTQNRPVNYFSSKETSIKSGIANFLNSDQIPIEGIEVSNSREIVSLVQNDVYALGFCRLSDIMDPANQMLVEKIKLLPIDRNSNGKIDYNEKIYDNLNAFNRGVWIGKYPKALYSNIYAISAGRPTKGAEVAFMKWVLTDGQQFNNTSGYSELALNERQNKVDDLVTGNIVLQVKGNDYAQLKTILLILAGVILFSFLLDAMLNYIKRKKGAIQDIPDMKLRVFNEETVTVLNGVYFDKSHTWAFMKESGLVKIGIDDFLQHVTGKITQLKMKKPGDKITKGEHLLSIVHDGKQLRINSPVSGIIREQNEQLNCKACLVNNSPFSEGWVYTVEPTNWVREIQFLFLGEKYKNWLKDEFTRLRDFLAVYAKPGTLEPGLLILQDGGEITDNPLGDLAPEIWEEFQTKFIDTSK